MPNEVCVFRELKIQMWSLTQCAQESGTAALYGSQFQCIFHLWPFPVGCDTHMKQTTLLDFLHVIAVNYKHLKKNKTDILLNLTNIDKYVDNDLENSHPM